MFVGVQSKTGHYVTRPQTKEKSIFFLLFFLLPGHVNYFGLGQEEKRKKRRTFPLRGLQLLILCTSIMYLCVLVHQKLAAKRSPRSQNSLIFFSLVRIPHIKDKGMKGLMDPDQRKKKIEFCESGKLFPQKGSVNRFTFLWVQFPERPA